MAVGRVLGVDCSSAQSAVALERGGKFSAGDVENRSASRRLLRRLTRNVIVQAWYPCTFPAVMI